MNAHKEGKTQALKGRNYFNPFSMVTQKPDWENFERGYEQGLAEERKRKENISISSFKFDAEKEKPKKKWWQFWK